MYQGLEVVAAFDLGVPGQPEAEPLRKDLLERLAAEPNPDGWSGFADAGGQRFKPLAGTVVRASFDDLGPERTPYALYTGLHVQWVKLATKGNDHFPQAGLYRRKNGGAHATVTYSTDRTFPVQEEYLKALIQAAYDDARYMPSLRLVVPVVLRREWHLTVTASDFARAFRGYEDLRGGKWQPTVVFEDAVSDGQKFRLLEQEVVPLDSDAAGV